MPDAHAAPCLRRNARARSHPSTSSAATVKTFNRQVANAAAATDASALASPTIASTTSDASGGTSTPYAAAAIIAADARDAVRDPDVAVNVVAFIAVVKICFAANPPRSAGHRLIAADSNGIASWTPSFTAARVASARNGAQSRSSRTCADVATKSRSRETNADPFAGDGAPDASAAPKAATATVHSFETVETVEIGGPEPPRAIAMFSEDANRRTDSRMNASSPRKDFVLATTAATSDTALTAEESIDVESCESSANLSALVADTTSPPLATTSSPPVPPPAPGGGLSGSKSSSMTAASSSSAFV